MSKEGGASDASNEPIEVKLIAAASDGMVRVTPEKCERIREILRRAALAQGGDGPPRCPSCDSAIRNNDYLIGGCRNSWHRAAATPAPVPAERPWRTVVVGLPIIRKLLNAEDVILA